MMRHRAYMDDRWTHRARWAILLLFAFVIFAVGAIAGWETAHREWAADMECLDQVMAQIDRDIKAGELPADGHARAAYFGEIEQTQQLPLEAWDDHSVTYYVGPLASYSARIDFDESGVRGFSIED